MTETPKRLYDLVFLIVPEKDEQGTVEVVEEFRKLLTDLGAVLEKDESIGRRRLAYQIRKKTEATYHNFLFRADSKAVSESFIFRCSSVTAFATSPSGSTRSFGTGRRSPAR